MYEESTDMASRKRKSQTHKKRVNPVFRIYTEGEETEINYIKNYIKDFLECKEYFKKNIVLQQPNDYSPYGLLTAAKKEKETGDIAWLVFDCDAHPKKPQTFTEAADADINIAYSSICFETWILLHFAYSAKPFSCCDEIKKELTHHFPNGYEKSLNNLFNLSVGDDMSRLSTARKNATILNSQTTLANAGKKIWEYNPYTDFYKLLDDIEKFIKEH